jgi:hypothetical protein
MEDAFVLLSIRGDVGVAQACKLTTVVTAAASSLKATAENKALFTRAAQSTDLPCIMDVLCPTKPSLT